MALMNPHQALFEHRAIDTMHSFPLIAVIDGDFVHLTWHIRPPAISVNLSVADEALQLSFMIEKTVCTEHLPMSANKAELIRADYLWEKDCFECFIQQPNETGYLEMNANLSGEYNIYQFTAYRSPEIMPPVASDGYSLHSFADCNDTHLYFGFEISPVDDDAATFDLTNLKLNPAAILYPKINGQAVPIYYAHQHAAPPDFHDKAYWQRFDT